MASAARPDDVGSILNRDPVGIWSKFGERTGGSTDGGRLRHARVIPEVGHFEHFTS
jgi:hypothetical protein